MIDIPTPSLVPRWVPYAAGVAFVLTLVGFGYAAFDHAFRSGERSGKAQVQAKWDADRVAMARELAMEREHQVRVTQIVETRYIERVRTIYKQSDALIQKVDTYVPSDAPDLPGGWRVYHDAAVRGQPLPDPAGIAAAAPVPARVAAVTVARNYAGCQANAAAVKAWQDWAREQASTSSSPRSAAPPRGADE